MTFIDPFQKTQCPYCGIAFHLGDCAVVSKVTSGKVLRQPPHGRVERLVSRMWVKPLVGSSNVRELASRQCPQCSKLLPHNIEHVNDNITIAVVGDSSSGKSHYIAVIIDQLKKAFQFKASSQEVEVIYQNNYYKPLFGKLEQLPLTQPSYDPISDPLIYELTVEGPPRQCVNLLIYDAAGGDIVNQTSLVLYKHHILNAKAIIFLADPWNMPGFLNRLAHHLRPDPNLLTGRLTADALNWIVDIFKLYTGQVGGEQFSIPIAITLSKSDLIKYLIGLDQFGFLCDPLYSSQSGIGDSEVIDNAVRELLKEIGEDSLLRTANTFTKVSFFATSATGSYPNDQGKYTKIEPNRCLEPLLWIFKELRLLDGSSY